MLSFKQYLNSIDQRTPKVPKGVLISLINASDARLLRISYDPELQTLTVSIPMSSNVAAAKLGRLAGH